MSGEPVLTEAALVLAGAIWMMSWVLFNIGVQLSAPRWDMGRSLAAYQAASSGGIAVDSWGWGYLTDSAALLIVTALMTISPLFGIRLRMPRISAPYEEAEVVEHPEVPLALTGRSGPVVVEIEYRVAQENAQPHAGCPAFPPTYGTYGWSIARDIADPESSTERYHCPTWFDYLRQRNRSTQSERAMEHQAIAFHIGSNPVRVRRMLERPFGSVRWKDDTA
ncbi:MFS transporter [Bradyrhizobium sp. 153]|uniref:MFS transporter n=1 Tax=Bradyrhizobium sp. 153 TaxID=2782627 RepID=UPI002112768E|nr:MFS transporter [Bradyrhizobium sp. 153]